MKKKIIAIIACLMIAGLAYAQNIVKLGYSDGTDRNWSEFENIENMLRVSSQDYLISILEELVSGHDFLCISGTSHNIGTNQQNLWSVPFGTQTEYVFPSAAATVTVVSSSATDNQAGVGARSVLISGLDANYIESSETLLLHPTDGTIAVTSVNSYLRINNVAVVTAGSSGRNAGNLTIKSGADIVSYIVIGDNNSLIGAYTVPAGKTAYIISVKGSAAGTKNVDVHLFRREYGSVFQLKYHRTINDAPYNMTLCRLPEKTDIKVSVHSDITGGSADISMEGWLEDN